MAYTHFGELTDAFITTNDKEGLLRLKHDVQLEMNTSLEVLQSLEGREARDEMYAERYQLTQLRKAIGNRLTHLVRREMAERKR